MSETLDALLVKARQEQLMQIEKELAKKLPGKHTEVCFESENYPLVSLKDLSEFLGKNFRVSEDVGADEVSSFRRYYVSWGLRR